MTIPQCMAVSLMKFGIGSKFFNITIVLFEYRDLAMLGIHRFLANDYNNTYIKW